MRKINILFFQISCVLFLLSSFLTGSVGGQIISKVNNVLNSVALTFDDGPSAVTTPRILEILARYKARATFFVTGVNAERYPQIMRAISKQGHEIGNHTYCHFDLLRTDYSALEWQISAAQNAIARIVGFGPKIFRPPYSRINETVKKALQAKGLKVVMWSVSPADYDEPSPAKIAEYVLSNIRPGSIVVLHDYRWQTVLALERILEGLRKKGLRSVTVSELLQ